MFGAALRQYLAAERRGGGAVEDALLLEAGEDVGIQHLGPLVAVVAAGIAATEDVAEVRRRAASRHPRQQVGHGSSLNGFRIELRIENWELGIIVRVSQIINYQFSIFNLRSVESDVGVAQVQLPQAQPPRHVVLRGTYLVDVFRRQHLAALPVAGEGRQEFGLVAPVLHHLRRHLHEVALHVGAAQALVLHIAQHAVHGVPHLVHEGLHLAESQQRRGIGSGLAEIAHHLYLRPDGAVLAAKLGHPGAAAFRRPREHVQVEQPHLPLAVEDAVHPHLLVVDGHFGGGLEAKAVEAPVEAEDALAHCLQREIGAQLLAVEGIALLFEFLREVGDVPRHKALFRILRFF